MLTNTGTGNKLNREEYGVRAGDLSKSSISTEKWCEPPGWRLGHPPGLSEGGTHPALFVPSSVNVSSTTHRSLSPADQPASQPGPVGPPGFASEGETFQHYQVLRREDGSLWELGRGAMGVTYKAFDTNLRCYVALKVISAQHLHSEVAGQRFIREARVAARLRHRNIATVYHLGVDPQGFFYSMEFIDGETLENLLARVGPFPSEVVLRIALQTARALAAASRQGLIHRDIKPANLMVLHEDEDGEDQLLVKVIDFGLARSYSGDDSVARLTATGFVGTPLYASPEQLEEKDLDVRSDIYSLGITLWILLTGRPPFDGKMTVVITQHLHAEPPWWQLGDCPEPMRALLERMLCKDPAQRYQSAGELRLAVEACLRQVTGRDHPSTEGPEANLDGGPSWPGLVKTDAGLTAAVDGIVPVELPRPSDTTTSNAGRITASPPKTTAAPLPCVGMDGLAANPRAGRRLLRPRHSLAVATVVVLCVMGLMSWRGLHGTSDALHPAARPQPGTASFSQTATAETLPVSTEPVPPASARPDNKPEPTVTAAPSFLLDQSGAALGVPGANPATTSLRLDEQKDESVDDPPSSNVPPSVAGSPGDPGKSSERANVSPAPAMQAAAPAASDKEDSAENAANGSPDPSAKSQSKTTPRTRTHHSARRAPTPAPNFFQKLFGIKPKPHSS